MLMLTTMMWSMNMLMIVILMIISSNPTDQPVLDRRINFVQQVLV